MVPNWMGVTDAFGRGEGESRSRADDYVVLVADVYGKDLRPTRNRKQASCLGSSLCRSADRALLRTRIKRASVALASKSQRTRPPLDADEDGRAFGLLLWWLHRGAGAGAQRCRRWMRP
jgi:hypothetical protein